MTIDDALNGSGLRVNTAQWYTVAVVRFNRNPPHHRRGVSRAAPDPVPGPGLPRIGSTDASPPPNRGRKNVGGWVCGTKHVGLSSRVAVSRCG